MASRAEQKAAARAQREAAQKAHAAAQAQRARIIYLLVAVVVVAAAAVVFIVASSGNGSVGPVKKTTQEVKEARTVDTLLAGIPESGNTIGRPNAPVTITEYGDLECPICDEFAKDAEKELIGTYVKSGDVKLVYDSLETASSDPSAAPNAFNLQQVAALAAGKQDKAWYYILDFYDNQKTENTPYVTTAFLDNIASLVPGLNLTQWQSDRNDPSLLAEVNSDAQNAATLGLNYTPGIYVKGSKGTLMYNGQVEPSGTVPTLGELQQLIAQVS